MASFNKFSSTVTDFARGLHDLNNDVLKIAFTDAPPAATNQFFGDITEIAAGNGYTAGGNVAPFISGNNVNGLYTLVLGQPSWTATGGNIAQFRYVVLYNSSLSQGNLLGWWDYGAEIVLTNGNTFAVETDQTNGVLTLQ